MILGDMNGQAFIDITKEPSNHQHPESKVRLKDKSQAIELAMDIIERTSRTKFARIS